jgi:hypothetical protein
MGFIVRDFNDESEIDLLTLSPFFVNILQTLSKHLDIESRQINYIKDFPLMMLMLNSSGFESDYLHINSLGFVSYMSLNDQCDIGRQTSILTIVQFRDLIKKMNTHIRITSSQAWLRDWHN